MTRRFRLDSCDGPEALHLGCLAGKITRRGERAERLMLHWWRLGFDPARALRCPECHGSGMALLVHDRSPYRYAGDPRCASCRGRGWSMPHERGTRG